MDITRTAEQLADRAVAIIGVAVLRPPTASGTQDQDALIARVLKKLQVTGDGQDPSAEESDNLELVIGPVVATLAQRGIVSITNTDAIPDAKFEPLADILAFAHAPDHGKANDAALAALAQKAELDLKNMARLAQVDELVDAMLADLQTRGIVYVSDEDNIPIEWFESLAQLLAVNAATLFERPFNPDAARFFENQLRAKNASQPTFEVLKAEYF